MEDFEKQHAPHIDDLERALDGKIDRADLVRELRKYVEEYNIEVDLAKGSIVRKFFGDPSALSVSSERLLAEIGPNDPSATFVGRILAVNERQIGGTENPRTIYSGLIGDRTKTIPFTAWNKFDFAKGDVLKVTNAYTKEWQGEPQLNFGDRARFEKLENADDFEVVPFERAPNHKTVSDFRAGQRGVVCTARIIDVEERQIQVRGEPRKLWSGRLGDATGVSRYTAWEDLGLKAGEVYTIANAYTREFRGVPELQMGNDTEVNLTDTKLPTIDELTSGVATTIEKLEQRGGAVDVTLNGFILEVREGSGLIYRCPECNRMLQSGVCNIHDKQKGLPDLRIKAILDDGTGSLLLIMGKNVTEQVLGYSLDVAEAKAKEVVSSDIIWNELQDKLILAPTRITGNITNDDWGLMMIGRTLSVETTYNAETEALRFMESLELGMEVA